MENLKKYFESQDIDLTKAEKLNQAIMGMIDDGVLESGDAMPPQREISEKLNMALSMVTKVFNTLKKRGILYGERGRGSFVAFKKQFAHDTGDRFSLDEDHLSDAEASSVSEWPILCNLVERLSFLNDSLPGVINLEEACNEGKTLKDYGAEYLRQMGIFVHPEDVMISHNAYIALWTAFQICCASGAVLGTPELSFVPLFRNRLVADNVRIIPLACDRYGILPDALEAACKAHRLNVVTCSPECELPTTRRMGKGRRMEIAQLARKYDLTIIENNWLLPDGREPDVPALAMFAPERTIYLEHGSKMLSGECFCSFSYVPQSLYEKFVYQRNIMAGPLSLLHRKMTQLWLDGGYAKRDFARKNREIIRRNELVREILDPLPVKIHRYARFCWLPLDKTCPGNILRQKLLGRGVLVSTAQNYLVGSVCHEDGILIGLGYEPSRERLAKALELIKDEALK